MAKSHTKGQLRLRSCLLAPVEAHFNFIGVIIYFGEPLSEKENLSVRGL